MEECGPWYMCILLYVKLILCISIPGIYCQLEGPWYMCILLSVKVIWCSGIPYMYGWLEGDICPIDMCILLYVKLISCSGITDIYGELEMGGLGTCAFCYLWNFLGVAVLYTSVVNWRGYICPQYMCIVLYVVCIQCSGIPYIYGQLEWGTSTLRICAFCCMWNLFGVVVLQISMVNWRWGDICPNDMCILLYVKLMQCRLEGVVLPADLPSLV